MKTFSPIIIYLLFFKFTSLIALHQGERAWLANARFIASVRLRELERERLGSGFLCTATLINNWHVVTTATCVTFYLPSELQIVLGTVNLNTRTSQEVIRDILRMYFHPTFERISETSDFHGNVAVIRFTRSIRESTSRWSWLQNGNRNLHIQPVRTSSMFPNVTERCAFYSWGQHSSDTPRDPNLLMANLLLTNDHPLCSNSSTVFCAGDANMGAALCNNFGGSMICEYTFFGIAITDSCQGPGHLHSIASYREWILEASKANSIFSFSYLVIVSIIFILSLNKFQ